MSGTLFYQPPHILWHLDILPDGREDSGHCFSGLSPFNSPYVTNQVEQTWSLLMQVLLVNLTTLPSNCIVNANVEIIACYVDETGTHVFCTCQARDFLGKISGLAPTSSTCSLVGIYLVNVVLETLAWIYDESSCLNCVWHMYHSLITLMDSA
jgi:hypothetical protein